MFRSASLGSLGSLFALTLLAATATGCAAESNGTDSTEEDQTGSLIKAGTYRLSGSAQAWTIKDLVLKSDGSYTVVMYPGRAFPIDDVKTTTGKWTASGNTLSIKFAKGNVFEKWAVTKSGSKLHFSDQVESSEFDMTYTGSGQADPVEPCRARIPVFPRPSRAAWTFAATPAPATCSRTCPLHAAAWAP